MKTFPTACFTLLSIAFFLSLGASASAQKTNTWQGGTPGREQDWHCPANWSTNAVPNEFSQVVIPDVSTTTLAPPVIHHGKAEVNALFLASTALLTLEQPAELVVFGSVEGLTATNFVVQGTLCILNETDRNRLNRAVKTD